MKVTIDTIPVPFVSQVDKYSGKHRNDCGAASAVMILHYCGVPDVTVDEFYNMVQAQGDVYLSVMQLIQGMAHFEVMSNYMKFENKGVLFDYLSRSYPIIALINYGAMKEMGYKPWDSKFVGAHFIVLVGMTHDRVLFLDPLWPEEYGLTQQLEMNKFFAAWKANSYQGNMDYLGIYITGTRTLPDDGREGDFDDPPFDVEVVTPAGLHLRTKPEVSPYNIVWPGIKAGEVVKVFEVDEHNTITWGCISKSQDRYIALRELGTNYVRKV